MNGSFQFENIFRTQDGLSNNTNSLLIAFEFKLLA